MHARASLMRALALLLALLALPPQSDAAPQFATTQYRVAEAVEVHVLDFERVDYRLRSSQENLATYCVNNTCGPCEQQQADPCQVC